MKSNSRTKQTVLNASANLIDNIIKVFIKFASRYVFIFTLGQQYLGVSALFSSIITMLSLADLGFGIALPQALYEPLAKQDENQIKKIMQFYEKVYVVISACILGIGIALLPFLRLIIGNQDISGISNINTIYVLFIVQSAVSYLFVYKRTLFVADQKNYIVTVIESFTSIISTIVQIVTLLITKNYILYLLISIAAIVAQNLFISYKCDKCYPFLKNKKNESKLEHNEIRTLVKKIYALFIYKVAIAVETGTDNLIMTAFCGLTITGLCSNYTLITTSVASILMMVMSAATASIGNVIVTESNETTYKLYKLLDFIGFWVYSVCAISMVVLVGPFIRMFLGTDYMINTSTVVVLCMNFYICGVQNINSNFRNAYGLFYEGRYRPIFMIIINISSSIVLAKIMGVTGIFIGTLLSRLLTVGIFDPYIVFKYGLKYPLKEYYKSHLSYHFITIIIGAGMFWVFAFWNTQNILTWVLKAISVFILTNLMFVIIFNKNNNFILLIRRIKVFRRGMVL
ncbi:MAG: sugar translocase [Tyzzerella sp.]|nr:sugar translocase [Tyzzerella sp.]